MIIMRFWCVLLLLTTSSVHVSALSRADFSDSLQNAVVDMLGSDKYKKRLEQIAPNFKKEILNGKTFTKMFADDINRKVIERAEVVKKLKKTINDAFTHGYTPSKEIPKCCPEEPLNLRNDPRFALPTNDEMICHYGKDPSPTEPVTGMSDELLDIMKLHHARIPSLKWQYYGNEHGTLYTYPAVGTCGDSLITYDPRVRPWYSFAVSTPKDLVIMIDKSQSMKKQFGSNRRLYYAIKAATAVINSANPNDHIGVMTFADQVQFCNVHTCYSKDLALMTPTNKEELTKFVSYAQPENTKQANFSNAIGEAFRLLANSKGALEPGERPREKGIMLLSAGLTSDTLAEINRTIIAGKLLAGLVKMLAFGIHSDSSGTRLLETVATTMFKHLDNSSEQNIRKHIGEFNNHFTKPADDENVIFTQPYIGSQGLGLIISECLTVYVLGKVQGVTCADMKVDTFFSEIVDFRLGQLSYSFFVDSRSRILIHPLLPRPDIYYKEPIFLDMESVEISSETSEVKQRMLSGSSESMTTSDLKISLRRGDSPLEGVSAAYRSATYYWSPIDLMNASVALVIVGEETNDTLSWETTWPPVLLTDELIEDQTNDRCNYFGRVGTRERSAVKLSLRSFRDSYYYTIYEENRIPELKSYLQGDRRDQSLLAVKTGVREAIAMTYELEKIWKSNSGSSSSSTLGRPIYRYVGTREGVYRIYPGVHMAKSFDPTQQPQYRRAEAIGGKISVFTETDSNGQVITSFTKAFSYSRNEENAESVILGVIGVDVKLSSFYNFLTTQFDRCNLSAECFAIDRSGVVVIHKNFIRKPPKTPVHITEIESEIAYEMVHTSRLVADSCVSYEDITNQLFWKANFTKKYTPLNNSGIYEIDGLDMFVVVKTSGSRTGRCSCPPITGKDKKPKCHESGCECPCYNATAYNYCSGNFAVTNSTKACYPATVSPDSTESSKTNDTVKSLSSCVDCTLLRTESESDCNLTGCCWSENTCMVCETEGTEYCDSLCVTIVIAVAVGVLVLTAVVVVVVLACRRRRCRLPSKPSSRPQHTTVVAVSAVGPSAVDPYSHIPPLPTSSTTKDRSDYLSFSPSPDQTPSVSTATTVTTRIISICR